MSQKENGAKVGEEKKPVNLNEAKAALEQEKAERAQRCAEKIQRALQEDGCFFDITATLTSRGTTFNVTIAAKER